MTILQTFPNEKAHFFRCGMIVRWNLKCFMMDYRIY